ncbi:TetR/AcrR family transcriptional regulator [Vibrio metschnikovii]|uniref:TetR/AcrR family transcriptional regulator n=1 Tax=Vibrio metschnikovii TaxID=28172 RepID=UPI002FE63792
MNPKRQLLIDTALDLFYKNGINSIGINEVISVSGVAKRTLYSHFESKEALIIASLQKRHEIFTSWLEHKLSGSNSNQDVIHRLFLSLASWFEHKENMLGDFRGCFFINTSAEFSDMNSEIFQFCHFHKEQVREIISRHLISTDNTVLDAICIMKEGAIVTAHLGGNGNLVTSKCIQILESFEC